MNRLGSSGNDIRGWFPLFPAAMAVLAVVATLMGEGFMGPARVIAMAALILQIAVELYRRRNRFLTSPLFLLAATTTTFFSFFQGIWGGSVILSTGKMVTDMAPSRDFTTYVGSTAEQVVIAFGMACLACYSLAARKETEIPDREIAGADGAVRLDSVLLIAFVLLLSLLNCTMFEVRISNERAFSTWAQIGPVIPPLIAVALLVLARSVYGRGRWHLYAFAATAMAGLGALVYVREGKLVVFIACALALYVLRLYRPAATRLLLAGAMVAVSGLVVMMATQEIRHSKSSTNGHYLAAVPEITTRFRQILLWKTVWRQTESGFCLGNAMKAHLDEPFDLSKQNFWLAGLVPRAIRPDKPSLSLGGDYAARYCNMPPDLVGPHSASITLLGQPVIHGGWFGLVLHSGLLLFALAAIERLNRDPRTLAAAMTGALLPWLIDFDQDFVLYVANAVKFGLVMTIVIVPVRLIEKRRLSAPNR